MLNSNSKNYKKILIIAGAVALIVSFCFGYIVGSLFTSKNSSELQDPNISIKNEVSEPAGAYGDDEPFYSDNVYQMPEKLVFKNCSSESTLGTITLEAIVYPDSASNKEVDWSVAWSDASIETSVSEYLTVTPTYDGSTQVTVECIQAFEGEIVITVTTCDGGFTATCLVIYEGHPSSIALIPTGEDIAEDGVYYFSSSVAEGKKFDIELSNFLGDINPTLYTYTVNIEGRGGFYVRTKTVSSSGEVTWSGESQYVGLVNDYEKYVSFNLFASALGVSFKPYESRVQLSDGYQYTNAIYSFNTPAGFMVTITENETGISTTLTCILNVDDVQSVTLTESTLIY